MLRMSHVDRPRHEGEVGARPERPAVRDPVPGVRRGRHVLRAPRDVDAAALLHRHRRLRQSPRHGVRRLRDALRDGRRGACRAEHDHEGVEDRRSDRLRHRDRCDACRRQDLRRRARAHLRTPFAERAVVARRRSRPRGSPTSFAWSAPPSAASVARCCADSSDVACIRTGRSVTSSSSRRRVAHGPSCPSSEWFDGGTSARR